jgi:chromosome segregation ATPase
VSDIVDLSFLSGKLTGLEREARLMRLQVDNLASRATSVDQRLGAVESAIHALTTEVSREFGQVDAGNRLAAIEGRLNGIDQRLVSAENRLSSLAAGQNAHTQALMRIADTQSEHTARLAAIETWLGRIEALLQPRRIS